MSHEHGSRQMSKRSQLCHPLEITFAGASGSGKTTLIEKLIAQLSSSHLVGYFKHDAHCFQMDRAGKDTDRAAQAGARVVAISSMIEQASRHFAPWNRLDLAQHFSGCDLVLAEGWKRDETLEKLLFIDGLQDLTEFTHVLGCITHDLAAARKRLAGTPLAELPLFDRNNVDGIANWISNRFLQLIERRPLKGLILSGGYSTRMGRDKALIKHDGQNLVERTARLLKQVTGEVHLSVRADQLDVRAAHGLPMIADSMSGIGPMAGILSAMDLDPAAAWLVLGCDLPAMSLNTLKQLVEERDPWKAASCLNSPTDGMPEPLCAIWEPRSRQALYSMLGLGRRCPRAVLLNASVKRITAREPQALFNMNRPQDLEEIRKKGTSA